MQKKAEGKNRKESKKDSAIRKSQEVETAKAGKKDHQIRRKERNDEGG